MAFVRLKNNHGKIVSAEQGITIWRVMNGEVEGTHAQKKFCENVVKIYLNPQTAPKSYLATLKNESRPQPMLPYKD